MAKEIRVTTFNVQHCCNWAHYLKTKEHIVDVQNTAEAIRRTKPDIVGLNEMYDYSQDFPECNKQTEVIANTLGFKNYEFAEGKFFEWNDNIGNSIMSNYPFVNIEKIKVPAPNPADHPEDKTEYYEDRIILKITIDVDGTLIDVVSTHFGLTQTEAKNMMGEFMKIIDKKDKPLIMMGDFNLRPESEIIKPLQEKMKCCATEMNNTDGTLIANLARIDYIFVSDDIEVLDYEVIKEVISDHYPVRAVLKIKG